MLQFSITKGMSIVDPATFTKTYIEVLEFSLNQIKGII